MAEDTALDDTTYYNAQPVAAQVQLNWAEIGQNFSDMLQGEVTARQEKKAAIDKDTREQIRTINEVQQGQNATANQWWLRGSQEMINQLSMANGMLKSGKLPPSEYTIMRQNMSDGVDDIIGVYTDFNKVYEDRMSRMQNKDSQDIEPFLMEMLEGFGNFHETAIVIDPTTGVMALAGVDDQGMIIDDPNKIRSTTALKGMLGTEYDRYDLSAATDEYASKVGVWEEVINVVPTKYRKGYRAIVSDPTGKPVTVEELQEMGMTAEEAAIAVEQYNLYKASEDNLVTSIMADWQSTSSILTNHIDVYTAEGADPTPYTFTFDEATRQPNEILLTYNEAGRIIPDFTEEQEEAVRLAIRTDVRNKFDKKITSAVTVAAPIESVADQKRGAEKDALDEVGSLWAQVYYGDRDEKETALQSLIGLDLLANRGIYDFNITDKGIEFISDDPRFKREILPYDSTITIEEWMEKGSELSGKAFEKDYSKKGEDFTSLTADEWSSLNIGERNLTETPQSSLDVVIADLQGLKFGKDEDEWVKNIQAAVAGMGNFKTDTDWDGKNEVTVTSPDGESIFIITSDTKEKDFISWVASNVPPQVADVYVKTKGMKRTIPQIMEQDGVTRAEAIKIFNAQ
jgi:hypothetical protein